MISSQAVSTYSSATGGAVCAAGTFYWDLRTGKWLWSDELYSLHGYRRGEVVPTLDLVLAHKDPGDRAHIEALYRNACTQGGPFFSYHRLIDAREHERRVFTIAEGLLDEAGAVHAVHGYMLDLSESLRKELDQATHEAVERATATRATIEQAKGYLMCLFHVDTDTAFGMLLTYSQHTNTKLATLAKELVDAANNPGFPEAAEQLARTFLPSHAGPSAPSGK